MWLVVDPVGQGLVASLGRPGGNVTGITHLVPGLTQKHVELLREIVPGASRFTAVVSPGNQAAAASLRELEVAGRLLGVSVSVVHVSGPSDFDGVLGRVKKDGAAGIIAISDPVTFLHRRTLVHAAVKHRLPGIYWSQEFVEDGGLMTYGASLADLKRHTATYVDRILRGAKPADLPIEQPTKFQLVINLKTAKALGLTIPSSLLPRADQIIE
jgi:putative tryptophan/tyrosine transport system substrate-binding protein